MLRLKTTSSGCVDAELAPSVLVGSSARRGPRRGQGVPQDYVQAHMWFNLAAAQGDPSAAKQRDLLALKMTPSQIEKAQALAAAWKPKTTGQ